MFTPPSDFVRITPTYSNNTNHASTREPCSEGEQQESQLRTPYWFRQQVNAPDRFSLEANTGKRRRIVKVLSPTSVSPKNLPNHPNDLRDEEDAERIAQVDEGIQEKDSQEEVSQEEDSQEEEEEVNIPPKKYFKTPAKLFKQPLKLLLLLTFAFYWILKRLIHYFLASVLGCINHLQRKFNYGQIRLFILTTTILVALLYSLWNVPFSHYNNNSSKDRDDDVKDGDKALNDQVLELHQKLSRFEKSLRSCSDDSREILDEELSEIVEELVNGALNKALDFGMLIKPQQSEQVVQALLKEELVDFAAFSTGARILHHQTSETYRAEPKIWWRRWLFHLFCLEGYQEQRPEYALIPTQQLGECWAMKGSKGYLTVLLGKQVAIEGFAIEHVDRRVAHVFQSAPKELEVWAVGVNRHDYIPAGWEEDGGLSRRLLARHTFDIHQGKSLQAFWADREVLGLPVRAVQLKILGNWGNEDWTCLYRFMVFGTET